MHLLLVHQNFPGQFRDLGPMWLAQGHVITALSAAQPPELECGWGGLEHVRYSWDPQGDTSPEVRGRTVGDVCSQLKQNGLKPDLILAHSGWGEALHLSDVWPQTPLVVLPELWGSERALGFGFDPALPTNAPDPDLFDSDNTIAALSIEKSSVALVPCLSQWQSFPNQLRSKIQVLPEGLPLERYGANPSTSISMDGRDWSPGDKLVTMVSRHLEPLRGLREALKAWPQVHEIHPDAQLLLVGYADAGGYGVESPRGNSHLADALASLPKHIAATTIHSLGVLSHKAMVSMLQCSACHLALSYPYTLSWSNLEALACKAPVVTNLASPLSFEIQDGISGHICQFGDQRDLAELIVKLLDNPTLRRDLGEEGYKLIERKFSLDAALEAYDALFKQLTGKADSKTKHVMEA